MKLLPIYQDEAQNSRYKQNPECLAVLQIYPDYYQKIGFNRPWIGYFVSDGNNVVGCGGYKGKPKDGTIEIAYGTFKNYEGQGTGTGICRLLVSLALHTDPSIRITARTLPDNNASIKILKKNGFVCLGMIDDEEDGAVLEWEYKKKSS